MPRLSARRLFFLYAHPCGEVLIRKKRMARSQLLSIRRSLLKHELPHQPPLLFSTAMGQLALTASQLHHSSIDSAVIRQYFWHGHDKLVGKNALCRILPARIIKANGRRALVSTPAGLRNVNIPFIGKVKPGDTVTVHYSYACEKIPPADFRRLWRMKR